MIQYFHPYLKWSWILDFPIFFHFCALEHFRPATKKNSEMKFIFFCWREKNWKTPFLSLLGLWCSKEKLSKKKRWRKRARVRASVCVCVRVCVREWERESEREWDSQPIDHFNVQTFSFTSILEFLQFVFSFDSTDFEVKKFFVTFKKSWTTSQKNSSQKHSMHYRGQLDKRVYQ